MEYIWLSPYHICRECVGEVVVMEEGKRR
jgi:hypothetical protein